MIRHGFPTTSYRAFDKSADAQECVAGREVSSVIKAVGTTPDARVVMTRNSSESLQVLKEFMLDKTFGEAGNPVIVEEELQREGASVIIITDGLDSRMIPPVHDCKSLYDGRRPNTGGMGCYGPVPSFERASKQACDDGLRRSPVSKRSMRNFRFEVTSATSRA